VRVNSTTFAAVRLLSQGPIAELVRAQRWDDALAALHSARETGASDSEVAEAIRTVRDQALRHGLEALGSIEATPVRTKKSAALAADEQYLFGLIDGATSTDALLDRSTLGRHRTVGALTGLVACGVVRIEDAAPSPAPVPTVAPAIVRSVVVADAHAPSAAITRTMLRLVLGGSIQLETASTTALLLASAHKHEPDLLVVELTFSGGSNEGAAPAVTDGLAAVRAVRRALGRIVPALVIASRMELALAAGRAPERCTVVARPIERTMLIDALGGIGLAIKS
jgi:hypothetical protein